MAQGGYSNTYETTANTDPVYDDRYIPFTVGPIGSKDYTRGIEWVDYSKLQKLRTEAMENYRKKQKEEILKWTTIIQEMEDSTILATDKLLSISDVEVAKAIEDIRRVFDEEV